MHLGKKNLKFKFMMKNEFLQETNLERGLGVYISDHLKWSYHIDQAVSKANRMTDKAYFQELRY